jgi:hypothetical protein
MVVDDLDIVCVSRSPAETDPPLLVDADAVLAGAISLELLKAVARRNPEVVEDRRSIEHAELSESDPLNVTVQLPHREALEETFGIAVTEAFDHAT